MNYLLVLLKGMGMGAADVVPGVSGGTIAFITGIYDKLLSSINAFNFGLIKTFKEDGIKGVWQAVNGTFLLSLFAGIGISVIILSKRLEYVMEEHPVLLWSFFFGLIVASVIYIGKQVKKWNVPAIIGLLIGAAVVIGISLLPPLGDASSLPFLFVCGMIAICAMILPGISGSFILLILGAYQAVLKAVGTGDFVVLGTVAAGAIVGLLAFSRVLKWLFNTYENTTVAVLTGFLIGSLWKIWPWKHVTEIHVKHIGEVDAEGKSLEEVVPLVEQNVLPGSYDVYTRAGDQITGYEAADPHTLYAVLLAIAGFSLIFVIEILAKKLGKTND